MNNIQNKIRELSKIKSIIYGLHLIKRLLPNYIFFVKKSKWGNVEFLNSIIKSIEKYLLTKHINIDISVLREELLNIAPNSEVFPSVYSTYALDCCAAFDDLLSFILIENLECIQSISSLSINTVYIYVIDKKQNESISDEAIYSSLEMKNEILFQEKLIDFIQKENDNKLLINSVISEPYKSNIGL